MKKILFTVVILGFVTAALASRTDVWSDTSVVVQKVHLLKLADGGCAVSAEATYSKQDGGTTYEESKVVEVAGVNRTDCLNIMDTRAPVLFKNDKNL